MIGQIAVNIAGILVFLFLFWKKLKDDYVANFIFSTGFFIVAGILAGYFIAFKLIPVWWFWVAILGGGVGFLSGIIRFNIRFYEAFEAVSLGLFPWLALFFLADSVTNTSPFSLALFLFVSALIALAYFLTKTYKNFTWYKSGRLGFTGLAIAGLFFLIRAALALMFPYMLSFVGSQEIFLSGIISFGLFLTLFNLSRS